jgi:DNA polymerase-1
MLDAFTRGDDLHVLTAQAVLGMAEVSKRDRQLAKALNFGLLYGMGADGFRRYAKSQYALDLSLDDARRYRNAFFAAYPGLAAWHRKVGRTQPKETRTLIGRRMICGPKTSYTVLLNTPVQGAGADGLKLALALLWERRAELPGGFPVLAVHDEIVLECAADQAEAAAGWLQRAMIDAMADWLAPVPVAVEAKIGRTWAAER